jgi:F-type H+-transporting ATPase subunit b
MINIDGSVIIQIINFLFLIWVLNLVLFRPIRNVLIKRKEKIQGLEGNIESLNRDCEEKNEAFAAGIKNARVSGQGQKEAMIAEATEEEKKIIQEINQKALEQLTEIREKISRETGTVKSALQQEVDDFAKQISQKLLGRAI